MEDISEIFIFGEVTINKHLVEFLMESEVVLHFFNYYGYHVGSFYLTNKTHELHDAGRFQWKCCLNNLRKKPTT